MNVHKIIVHKIVVHKIYQVEYKHTDNKE